jgi:hypothetical protein
VAGASERTERVQYVNANWTPGDDGAVGEFELLVVCESGARHSLPMAAGEASAVVALTRAGSVLLFDAESKTLVVANMVGEWIPSTWSAGDRRTVEDSTSG